MHFKLCLQGIWASFLAAFHCVKVCFWQIASFWKRFESSTATALSPRWLKVGANPLEGGWSVAKRIFIILTLSLSPQSVRQRALQTVTTFDSKMWLSTANLFERDHTLDDFILSGFREFHVFDQVSVFFVRISSQRGDPQLFKKYQCSFFIISRIFIIFRLGIAIGDVYFFLQSLS